MTSVEMDHQEAGDFPETTSPVTGARLDGLAKTIFDSNVSESKETSGHRQINLHRSNQKQPPSGPLGARYYLSPSEGQGFWDMLQIRKGLALSVSDAVYTSQKDTYWPAEPVLKIRVGLSGRMMTPEGTTITGAGDCHLHSFSGKQVSFYSIEAEGESYQAITVHAQYSALSNMGLDGDTLGTPFDEILKTGEYPDLLQPAPISVTLRHMANEILQSRDIFHPDTRRFYLAAKVEEILISVIEKTRPQPTLNIGTNKVSSRDLSRLSEAHRILESSYATPPKVAELARLVGINSTKLKLGFRELYGETIKDFLNRLRMESALGLVENSDLSFSEIAYRSGYNYPANFTQAFRKHFGLTPSEARSR